MAIDDLRLLLKVFDCVSFPVQGTCALKQILGPEHNIADGKWPRKIVSGETSGQQPMLTFIRGPKRPQKAPRGKPLDVKVEILEVPAQQHDIVALEEGRTAYMRGIIRRWMQMKGIRE